MAKALLLLAGLLQAFASSPYDLPTIDVSRYFNVSANSTCGQGVTPTMYAGQGSNAGMFANCSSEEHRARLMLDGVPETFWQSENGETPSITFTIKEVGFTAARSRDPPLRVLGVGLG